MKGFVKMTENNYVIKEDLNMHETLNQCWAMGQCRRLWANISPALFQCLVFAGTALSQAVTHSQRRDIEHVLVQCRPIVSNAATLKQHKGNVTCLAWGGCSWRQSQCYYTASLMRGDRPHCVYTPTPNPPSPPTTCHSSHLLCSPDR